MKSNNKILAVAVAIVLLVAVTATSAMAAVNTGRASIGFSSSTIHYMPYGVSGVSPTLNLNFGTRNIDTSVPVRTYTSLNQGGYVVNNASGGTNGYRVTVGLSSFDNGLEGASLTLRADSRGLIAGEPGAANPPILMGGKGYVELEADGLSPAVVLEAKRYNVDSSHTGLGRWGFNFRGDLKVYTGTIVAGDSRALMVWELAIV